MKAKRWLCAMLAAFMMCVSMLNAVAEPLEMDGDVHVTEDISDVQIDMSDIEMTPAIEAEYVPDEDAWELGDAWADNVDAPVMEADPSFLAPVETDVGQTDTQSSVGYYYARIAREETAVYQDLEATRALGRLGAGGVVLCLDEGSAYTLSAFETDDGVVEGYIANEALAQMSAADEPAILDALVAQGAAIGYQGDISWLLPRQAWIDEAADAEAPEEAPVVESDDLSEATEALSDDEAVDDSETTAIDESVEETDSSASDDSLQTPADQNAADSGTPDATDAEGEDDGAGSADETVPAPEGDVPDAPHDDAAQSIALTPGHITIGVGETYAGVELTILPADAGVTPEWTSSDSDIFTVDSATGAICGVGMGEASLTVTAGDAVASCSVTVKEAPGSISVDPASLTLRVGDTFALLDAREACITVDNGAACEDYTFTSDNADVAQVDQTTGLITATGKGSATIGIETWNGKSAALSVTVSTVPQSVRFAQEEIQLLPGETAALSAKAYDVDGAVTSARITYAIVGDDGANAVLELTDDGRIRALAGGTATISATADNGAVSSVNCSVKVLTEARRVTLNHKSLKVGLGETYKGLSYSVPEGQTTTVTWRSSDSKILSVNAKTGAFKALKKGKATVYARAKNGEETGCTVQVKAAPKKLKLSPASRTVTSLNPVRIVPSVDTACGAYKYTYANAASRNTVKLDAKTGLLTPLHSGTAKINVATYNGLKAVFTLKVVLPVSEITLPANLSIAEYQKKTLKPTGIDATGSRTSAKFSFSVTNGTGKAQVDAKGVVTGVDMGEATITVTAPGGVTLACPLTIVAGPKTIAFTPDATVIGVGESISLNPRLVDKRGGTVAGSFKASVTKATAKYASCSAAGVVKGKKPGKAVITVKAFNGVTKK